MAYYGPNSIEADGSFTMYLPDYQYCGVQISGQKTSESSIEVWGSSNKSRVEIGGDAGITVANTNDRHVVINNSGIFGIYGATIRATDGSESNGRYTKMDYNEIRWNYSGMNHGWSAIMTMDGVLTFAHDSGASS